MHSATAAINAGIELEAGQHLIGEPAGLSIPRNLNGNGSPTVLVPADAGAPPVINGGAGNCRDGHRSHAGRDPRADARQR